MSGKKYDSAKPPMDLIPSEAQLEEARVFGFGAGKYGRFNYCEGIQYTRLIAAAERHLAAIKSGEDVDPESGFKHWAHVRCCMSMLARMELLHPELDDRYKVPATVRELEAAKCLSTTDR